MTGFDILVLIVVGVSALLAFARGFVRELLSMAALALAILAVLWGLPVFREPVREIIQPGWMADTVLVVSIFLLIYIAVRVLTGRVHEWVHDSEPLGILDRTAGLLFGVARGFALLAGLVLLISSVAPRSEMLPRFMTEARFYPLLVLTADALKQLTPQAGDAAGGLARGASEAGESAAGGILTDMARDAMAGDGGASGGGDGAPQDGAAPPAGVDAGADWDQKGADAPPADGLRIEPETRR